MTEFITKPSQKTKTVAKVAGGGSLVGLMIFIQQTYVPRSELAAEIKHTAESRAEMRQFQSETWIKLMDVQLALEANKAALDMLIRLRAESVRTNNVATN